MKKPTITKSTIEDMLDESILNSDDYVLSEAIKKEISKNPDEKKTEQSIQHALNKLVSEERLAYEFYIGCIMAAGKYSKYISTVFSEIAVDELNDHCAKLTTWGLENGYEIPFKYSDYAKYSGKNQAKSIDKIKQNKEPIEYVELAVENERDSIKSYEELIQKGEMPYELNAILIQNYYDEIEHLKKLNSMKMVFDAGAVMA